MVQMRDSPCAAPHTCSQKTAAASGFSENKSAHKPQCSLLSTSRLLATFAHSVRFSITSMETADHQTALNSRSQPCSTLLLPSTLRLTHLHNKMLLREVHAQHRRSAGEEARRQLLHLTQL